MFGGKGPAANDTFSVAPEFIQGLVGHEKPIAQTSHDGKEVRSRGVVVPIQVEKDIRVTYHEPEPESRLTFGSRASLVAWEVGEQTTQCNCFGIELGGNGEVDWHRERDCPAGIRDGRGLRVATG